MKTKIPETQGFEPWVQLPVRQFSKLLLSATQARLQRNVIGEGRIRTHGGITTTVFKTAALDHSATSPDENLLYREKTPLCQGELFFAFALLPISWKKVTESDSDRFDGI